MSLIEPYLHGFLPEATGATGCRPAHAAHGAHGAQATRSFRVGIAKLSRASLQQGFRVRNLSGFGRSSCVFWDVVGGSPKMGSVEWKIPMPKLDKLVNITLQFHYGL